MRIFKRGKTWCVDYTYRGQRIRTAVGRSRRIAELTLKDIELKIAKGENLGIHEQPRILFRDYALEYLEFSKANKATNSWVRDCTSLNRLLPVFGDKYLFAIMAKQIEDYKRHRLEKDGRKAATINREIACLRHMFNKAIEWGYVKETPVKGVKMLKEPPGRVRFLEPTEIDALLKECSPHLRPIVITALNTGMRRMEILNLRWSNVNFRTRTITVANSKNNEPRFIPINQTLSKELKRLSSKRHTDHIFCDETSKPYVNLQKGFKAACRRAGILDFRFHDLRHTFAAHAVMAGVSIPALMQLLGHKTIKMTMRYTHLSQQHLQEAAGLIGLSLTGAMQKQMDSALQKESG